MLRAKGVVGKFVEFYGPGLDHLSLEDQATLANMAPEYGATCGFFPVDDDTLKYLNSTGRDKQRIELVEAYAKQQGFWRDGTTPEFTDTLALDIATVMPAISGPKRPQDRFDLKGANVHFAKILRDEFGKTPVGDSAVQVKGKSYQVDHGDVFIAAITSCTNTSNPSVMMAAGLVINLVLTLWVMAVRPVSEIPVRLRLNYPKRLMKATSSPVQSSQGTVILKAVSGLI